jgi:hypothetical protein
MAGEGCAMLLLFLPLLNVVLKLLMQQRFLMFQLLLLLLLRIFIFMLLLLLPLKLQYGFWVYNRHVLARHPSGIRRLLLLLLLYLHHICLVYSRYGSAHHCRIVRRDVVITDSNGRHVTRDRRGVNALLRRGCSRHGVELHACVQLQLHRAHGCNRMPLLLHVSILQRVKALRVLHLSGQLLREPV